MKQKDKNQKLTGAEGFHTYYSGIFGERWESLKKSLFLEPDHVQFNAGGKEPYFLDSASVRCAVSLPLKDAESILDMCAAPGGKTLVLAASMEQRANLLSNERSADRKLRLSHTVENCLPEEISSRVTVICKDGAVLCLSKANQFDRILLDAPCSSERYVIQDPNYLKDWSPSRIKTLSMAQWALLSSGWRMLKEGGYLLYSTCALNPSENDGVIEKLLKKFKDVEICEPAVSSDVQAFCSAKLVEGEQTKYGRHVLPDSAGGAGPLYFCLLRKKSVCSVEELSMV